MYPKHSFKTLGAYLFQTHLKGVVVVVNKPSRISPHEVLQSWLINTFYHLLVKDNKGEGGRLLTPFPWKGGGVIRERGA